MKILYLSVVVLRKLLNYIKTYCCIFIWC